MLGCHPTMVDGARHLFVMQLARLMTLSHGEVRMTRERWEEMRALEARRVARLLAS